MDESKKMEERKTTGLDGIVVEMLKWGGVSC